MGHTECSPIWSCSRWGLPCHICYQMRGALLPHHFTLTDPHRNEDRRYIFCGTFRQLTLPRRYLAPCPMEPGLSSLCAKQKAIAWPTPARSIPQLRMNYPLNKLKMVISYLAKKLVQHIISIKKGNDYTPANT